MGKLTDDQLRFIIDLDASGAQGQINTLTASISELEKANKEYADANRETQKEIAAMEKELSKLAKAGAVGTEKYNKLTKAIQDSKQNIAENEKEMRKNNTAIAANRKQVDDLTSGLKLSDMTMQQLRQRANQLRKQLDMTSASASPETYQKLQNELAKTEKAMGKLTEKQKSLTNVFTMMWGGVGANLVSGGFKMLFDTVKQGIQTITSFESANASLAAVLGTTQDGVQRLTDDAKRLGEVTEYSAAQVTQMQTELAKLGFNEDEILSSTESVLQFATATGSDIPEAAQLAGSALRAFGLDASEMERVVSTMGVATTKSALDFGYLQNSMSTIAPVAQAFGFSIEDTTAMLGTLANSGFDASSAATATRNILLNLADSNGKLAKSLGEPIKSLDDLAPALQKLQEKGVSLADALELTDKRSVAAFETFLNGADSLTTLRDSITGANSELAAMQQTKLDTVEGSIQLLQSAWEGLMLQFYDSKGFFKSAVDFVTKAVGMLGNVVKWIQENAKAVKILSGVIVAYLATGKAITLWRAKDITAILAQTKAKLSEITVTNAAKMANEALKKSLLTSPWGLIAVAIAAVVTGLIALVKWLNKASVEQEAFNNANERAKELADQNTESIRAEQNHLNALVGAIIETTDNEKLRGDLIDQLQKEYPAFLGNIEKEKITNDLLRGALMNANQEYEKRITLMTQEAKAQAYQEQMVELNKKLIQQERELSEAGSDRKKKKKREEIAETQKAIEAMGKGYEQTIVAAKKADQDLAHFNSLEGMSERMDSYTQKITDMEKKAANARSEIEKKYYEQQAADYKAAQTVLSAQYEAKKTEEDAKATEDRKQQHQQQAALDDKAYKAQLKALQDSYAKRKAEIIQQESEMTITTEESKRKQLELAKEQADAELEFAKKHGKATQELQIKAAQAQMALNKDNYSRTQKDLQKWLDDSLKEEKQKLLNKEMTQEEYDVHARELQTQHLDKLKSLMEQYGMDTADIEQKIAENKIKNQEAANKQILESAKKAREAALKLNKEKEKKELDLLEERHRLGLVTDTQYEAQRRQITDVYAKERLGIERIYYEAVKNLDEATVKSAEQAVADATAALDETLQDRLAKVREYTSELRDIFAETAAACGDTLGGQLMGNMANAMDAIGQFQEQLATGSMSMGEKIAAGVQMVGQVATQALDAASQITSAIFEMEANQLEAAKQKELAAVGDNAEEKERIEQEYAQKELDLKKKQADADAGIQSAQLWVNTAMGIASAWSSSMVYGPAGPVIAGILTAALLATAGFQQANIIAQRDAIKNQTLSGSGSSSGINESTASVSTTTLRDEYKPGGQGYSDGGYTGDGGVHEPAGIVHKGEYVVSQAELRNPSVVSMVRSIEGVRQGRKHGRAGVHGFADGGYTSDVSNSSDAILAIVQELADQVEEMKSMKIRAEVNYREFKDVESKIEKATKKGKL